MTGTRYQGFIKDAAGNIIEGASVEVRDQDTDAIVTIWSDRDTNTTKDNPTPTDANGYFFFYRTAGRYKITVTSASFSAVFQDVAIGNAQERDVGTTAGNLVDYSSFAAVAFSGAYSALSGLPTLGTMAAQNTGTAASEFRTNEQNDGRFLQITNNLNDLGDVVAARGNLGMGSSDAVTFATVNTGNGDNELYPMDQAVRTTDVPTFGNASADGHVLNRITADGRYGRLGTANTWTGNQDVTGTISATDSITARNSFKLNNSAGPNSTLDILAAPAIGSTNNIIETVNTTGLEIKTGLVTRMTIPAGGGVNVTGAISATTHIKPGSYTVATLPSASGAGAGAMIYVSDETGGAVPAFSDATNWRRVTDRAIVS